MNKSKQLLVIALGTIFVLAMFGCEGTMDKNPIQSQQEVDQGLPLLDEPLTTPMKISLSNSEVWLTGAALNPALSGGTLWFDVSFDGEPVTARAMTLRTSLPTPSTCEFEVVMSDGEGNFLWRYDLLLDRATTGAFTLTEQSPSDLMDIQRTISDTGFSEMYALNSDTAWFHFATPDIGHVIALEENMLASSLPIDSFIASLSPADQSIAATLADFLSYYEIDNTLHGNREGLLMAELLGEQIVLEAFVPADPSTPLGPIDSPLFITFDELCELAAICVMLKCPAAAVNPACGVCGTVAAFCFIVKVGQMFF